MNAKHVWILDEGNQGHLVQSRGLIREMAKEVPLEVSEIRIKPALPSKWGRSLAKRLLGSHPHGGLFRLLYPKTELPAKKPDLIVSSGPHSLTPLVFLGKHHDCPNVFIQGTLHVPEGSVTVVMRPFEGEHRSDYIFIPLLFTEITPAVVSEAKDRYLAEAGIRPEGPVNTLFIGNSSAKIRFSDNDWNDIIRFVNDQWKRDGHKWLITTSYRTGIELENRIRAGIDPDALLDAAWYVSEPRKVTKPFLGLADRVFITMDSLTMLSEAVSSGRPTHALCPADIDDHADNTHLRYVRGLAASGMITCIQPGRNDALPAAPPKAPEIDYTGPVRELLTRIKWIQ